MVSEGREQNRHIALRILQTSVSKPSGCSLYRMYLQTVLEMINPL